jgi:membrane associated rhomboid family serine protease
MSASSLERPGLRARAGRAVSLSPDGFVVLGAMLVLMWGSEALDALPGVNLDQYGIEPRDSDGLAGIAAAPFLHVGFGHLIGNSVPFVLMGAAIALSGAARVVLVTAIVALVSGLGTWLIAPAGTVHLGASGVVFGYATYLIARGVFSRRLGQLAVGALVVALWGSALLAGLGPQDGVSWQGHLFGAIGGLVAARVLSSRERERERERGPGDAPRRATAARAAAR